MRKTRLSFAGALAGFLALLALAAPLSGAELLLHWRFDGTTGEIVADASGHGHRGELARETFRRRRPERQRAGLHGDESGAVILREGSLVQGLTPMPLPESWTLSFWIRDHRPADERPEKLAVSEIVSLEAAARPVLDQPWFFRADPAGEGLVAGWQHGPDEDRWQPITVPAFLSETPLGDYLGYGWYRTRFYLPEALADRPHELHFQGVDEQGWVYVNGHFVGEQTVESTGRDTGQIWNEPFSVTVTPEHLRAGEENLLVVRTHASGGQAGIFEPVSFLLPEEARFTVDLDVPAGTRATAGAWEHVALTVGPAGRTLYINGRPAAADRPEAVPPAARTVRLRLAGGGRGRFTGELDDVRFFAGALTPAQVAALSPGLYHPEAEWLAEFEPGMLPLITAGLLSRERSAELAALGAPAVGALVDNLVVSRPLHEQRDIIWALGVLGGYEATAALVGQLDPARPEAARAANDALVRLWDENVFPAVMRPDRESARLLEKVLRHSPDTGLRVAAVMTLAEMDEDISADLLSAEVEQGTWWIRRYAALALQRMGLETDAGLAAEAAGWPMWRGNPARSGEMPHQLPVELHLQWRRELPAPQRAWTHQWDDRGKLDFDVSWSPVAAGGKVFVPSNANDSVTAYRLADGSVAWRFYADGPVRLAPAYWRGRLYFTADDGHLYCLRADSGRLQWKFRAGPPAHHLLGNGRIINFWAARGGPVIKGGMVYFAAGLWPLHGIFIYALDAASGEVAWVNDTTSSDYVVLPHGGADGYGGLVPQGYLAADEDQLVVAGGRGAPAYLDRHTGAVLRLNPRDGHKGGGSYAVHAVDGGGMGRRVNRSLAERVEALSGELDAPVFEKLAVDGRLVVTTEAGTIYCFGPEPVTPVHHHYQPAPLATRTGRWAAAAAAMLAELDEDDGYALLLGAGSGELLWELLLRSNLHILVVEPDALLVADLRALLDRAGKYGRRAAIITAEPAAFTVQPYLFSLIASEDLAAAGYRADPALIGGLLERLRPYGGIAWLGAGTALAGFHHAATTAAADRVTVEARPRAGHLFARRDGPLTGAGRWTHQYHDAANTLFSRDQRVRLPLGVLWFGGPSNHNILPRHSGGPRPQVSGGRQFFLGVETIAARCVYTGRALWEREFPGIGHPFTNLELEERWKRGEEVYMTNIPGATYIGSPFATSDDSVYLRYNGHVYRLDQASGATRGRFALPGRTASDIYGPGHPDWGHVSVQGDYLVVTSEPHLFEDAPLGWINHSGTSSRRLAVMDRHRGEVLWERTARVGFRHLAIVSAGETLYVIDGLSENAVDHLARRGEAPGEKSLILALSLADGGERWRADSDVFGTFLLYSAEHDILIEGGSQDLRRRLDDEPRHIAARRGADGTVLWESGRFVLPAAVRGEMLIPGRPGPALSLLSGENWPREISPAVEVEEAAAGDWTFERRYGCSTLNASEHLLLFRTGYAGYYDLEHESGTGNLSGFRAGCTANLLAADGVLNALDYTRSCTCSYGIQTSLALVHMPGDENIEFWTRYESRPPDPAGHGLNFGAPGRRVDTRTGVTWHMTPGTGRRHPSAVSADHGPSWVFASWREAEAGQETVVVDHLPVGDYQVRFYFLEPDPAVEPGQRVFDVLVNGRVVLAGLDIVRRAGGHRRGLVEEARVRNSENMVIELRAAAGAARNPVISGLEFSR